MNIERSIVIDSSKDKVWEYLTDGDKKNTWSPWVMFERDCEQTFEGTPGEVGFREYWNGRVIGEGEQVAIEVQEGVRIKNALNFMKPFKSSNEAEFCIEEKDGKVEVKWVMNGTLPLFLFFMKKQFEFFIGLDFDRGLMMLKSHIETGEIPSHTRYIGKQELDTKYYIGLERKSTMGEMSENMPGDFQEILTFLGEQSIEVKEAFTLYKKVDLLKDSFLYEVCFELDETQVGFLKNSLPESYKTGVVEKAYYAKVTHTGLYEYMMNPWIGIMMYMQADKLKENKKLPSLEVYETGPQNKDLDPKDYITHIYVPVK